MVKIRPNLVNVVCERPLTVKLEVLIKKSTFRQKVTVDKDRNSLHKQFEKASICFYLNDTS